MEFESSAQAENRCAFLAYLCYNMPRENMPKQARYERRIDLENRDQRRELMYALQPGQ
jgi:hypothetical protein